MLQSRSTGPGSLTHVPESAPLMHYFFDPKLKHFWIEQGSQTSLPTLIDVYGKVVVTSCSKASNISVHFKISASDDKLINQVTISPKRDGIWFAVCRSHFFFPPPNPKKKKNNK